MCPVVGPKDPFQATGHKVEVLNIVDRWLVIAVCGKQLSCGHFDPLNERQDENKVAKSINHLAIKCMFSRHSATVLMELTQSLKCNTDARLSYYCWILSLKLNRLLTSM